MSSSEDKPHIFVTGGMGFIGASCWPLSPGVPDTILMYRTGSHMVIVLLERGYKVTIFDDLSNACEQVYPRLKVIAGDKAADMRFIKVACCMHL